MQPGVVQPDTPTRVITREQPDYVTGALVAVILSLASVIAILWKRSERRYREDLKLATERENVVRLDGEAAREREVARADAYAERIASEREAYRETLHTVLEAHKQEQAAARTDQAALIRELWDRKLVEDRTRDAKSEDLVKSTLAVIDTANRRIGRRT